MSDENEPFRTLLFDALSFRFETAPGTEPLTLDELRRLAECACAKAVEDFDAQPERCVIALPAIFLERVLADLRQTTRQLTLAQTRGSELMLESQALKGRLRAYVAEAEGLRMRVAQAEGYARVLSEMRAACDICAMSNAERAPVVLVNSESPGGWVMLCADHANDPQVKGRRIDLREPHDDPAAGPEREMRF